MSVGKFPAVDVDIPLKLSYNSHMNQAKIYDLKNRLSYYLNKVRRGQAVRIYDRNCPIADIVPLKSGEGVGADEAYLLNLESAGIIKTSRKKTNRNLFSMPPGDAKAGDRALQDLLEERDSE